MPPALVEGVRLDDYKRCLDPLVALSTAAAVTTPHRARHRHPARRPARPHRPGQAGRHARPSLGWSRDARHRLRVEPGRGRGPRRRLRAPPRRRPRAPGGHAGHLVTGAGRVPRRVRRLRGHLVLAQAACSSRGCASSSAAAPTTRCSRPSWTAPTAGSPSAAAGCARPSRACARSAEAAGRDPSRLSVVPFGTLAGKEKLEHYAGLGVTEVVLRVRAGDPASVRAELESLAPLVDFAATLEQP